MDDFFSLLASFWKVCQVAAAPACPALHRPQMSGASVLFQANRRHAHRHLPDGDAGGAASDHMTPALPPYPLYILLRCQQDEERQT